MINKYFEEDLEKFIKKIKNRDNFAFARYADGEYLLMNMHPIGCDALVYLEDGWSYDGVKRRLPEDLLKSTKHIEDNYFYAITSPVQNPVIYSYYRNLINQKEENITFSDLWVNHNYKKFKHFLHNEIDEPVVLFASENFIYNKCPFKICDYLPIPRDCVNYYELHKDKLINSLSHFINYNNALFLISAGPLSEIIIHYLYINNPNNRYIDVGSSVDEIIHRRKTRPYMFEESFYSSEIVKWI